MIAALDHGGRQVVGEIKPIADPAFFRGPCEDPPAIVVHRLVQGHLNAGFAAAAREARRQNARVVEDQKVAGHQKVGKIRDQMVAEPRRLDIQQSRAVPRPRRALRDQVLGQGKIKCRNPHQWYDHIIWYLPLTPRSTVCGQGLGRPQDHWYQANP